MKKITEWLENDSEDCGILSPPMTDSQAMEFLKNYLLGENWYTMNPISHDQVNTEIVFEILWKYSKDFRKEWKAYRKKVRNNDGKG